MRILIVDDHELFRNGLRFQINAIDPVIEIVESGSFSGALRLVEAGHQFDKVFLDVMIPDAVDWREALTSVRDQECPPDAIIMSGGDDPRIVRAALDLGAIAFIPKSLSGEILESALRLVLVGGFSLAPQALRQAFVGGGHGGAGYDGPCSPASAELEDDPGDLPLTPRQREVLQHINSGMSNRRIAEVMDLSEATIKMHIGRLFKVLGAQSRTDALALARKRGIL